MKEWTNERQINMYGWNITVATTNVTVWIHNGRERGRINILLIEKNHELCLMKGDSMAYST